MLNVTAVTSTLNSRLEYRISNRVLMQWLLPELHEWFDCVQFYYLQFNTIRHAAFAVVPLSSLSCFFNLHSCRTYATHGVGKERGLDHYAIDSTQLKVEMFSDSDPPFCFGSPFST